MLTWKPRPEIIEPLEESIGSWAGTPYMPGQCVKGRGVDCVRFIVSVIREAFDLPEVEFDKLPQDIAMHDRGSAMAAMKSIKRQLELTNVTAAGELLPGDLIMVGPAGGGPGHGLIVGTRKNTIWHSFPRSGVVQTGLGFLLKGQRIFAIGRRV